MTERAWREEARAVARAVPYVRTQRIRRRLRERALRGPQRVRWPGPLMFAFGAGAALVLLWVLVPRLSSAPEQPSTTAVASAPEEDAAPSRASDPPAAFPSPDAPSSWALEVAPTCRASREAVDDRVELRLPAACVVSGRGLVLHTTGETETRLRGDATALELVRGSIEVHVDPSMPRAAPFVLSTAAVRVEVTGTRFLVEHTEAGGTLALTEGSVRVVASTGTLHRVTAGGRLQWTLEDSGWRVTTEPTPDATEVGPRQGPAGAAGGRRASPPARAAPTRRAATDELVRQLERLRARGEIAEAVTLLEEGLPRLGRRDREVLGFELGKLLERVRGPEAACAHWSSYARTFSSSRYADLVDAERTRLGCP